MIYQQEDFTPEVIDELKQLVELHYAEVGPYQFDFSIDWDKYLAMQDAGIVRLFTARDDSDQHLCGYGIYIISTHTHFATTIFAMQDALYLSPECRGDGAGTSFVFACEVFMGDVDAVTQAVTPELDISETFKRAGYVPLENLYVKKLTRLN